RAVDRLAARWDVAVEREAHRALVGEARRAGERVLLVKPQTWMNESGEALASLARFYRVDPARVIAVHDDVDLEPGRVRIRRGGRAGGNRGVESLMAALGDPGFLRIKVGVGRPPAGPVPADWARRAPPAPRRAALEAAGAARARLRARQAAAGVLRALRVPEHAEGVARDRAQPEAHGPRHPLRVGAPGRECAAHAAASRRRASARARGARVRRRRRVRGPERGGPLVWQNGSAASAGGRARGGGSAAGA